MFFFLFKQTFTATGEKRGLRKEDQSSSSTVLQKENQAKPP